MVLGRQGIVASVDVVADVPGSAIGCRHLVGQ
jgi:hypothetical protein